MSVPPDPRPSDGAILLLGWLAAKIDQNPSTMRYRNENLDLQAATTLVSDDMLGGTYRISITDVVS